MLIGRHFATRQDLLQPKGRFGTTCGCPTTVRNLASPSSNPEAAAGAPAGAVAVITIPAD